MRKLYPARVATDFRKYIAAAALTSLGSGMHFVAVSWFLYQVTGRTSSVGWIMLVSSLPGVLLASFIGVWVDRLNDKRICVVADLVRGVLMTWMALAIHFRAGVLPTIYVVSFFVAVCVMFFQPAVSSLIRDISAKESLLNANIISNSSMQIGMLAGASLAGLLVAHFGVTTVILINAASFFASAVLTAWIRSTRHIPKKHALGTKPAYLEEMRATRSYVQQNPFLVWLGVVQMFGSATLFIGNTLLPRFVDNVLHAGAEAFGVVDAAWGAGAIAGGVSLAWIARRFDSGRFAIIGPPLLAGAVALFLTSNSVSQAVAGYFSMGLVACMIRISINTVLVGEVDRAFYGKVRSIITMFESYISLGLYASVGYLGDHIPVRWVFGMLAAIILTGFVIRVSAGQAAMYRQDISR
jgi:MFS transporter, DHA3 family, macrolide efflux protein